MPTASVPSRFLVVVIAVLSSTTGNAALICVGVGALSNTVIAVMVAPYELSELMPPHAAKYAWARAHLIFVGIVAAAGAVELHVVPFDVSTLPLVLGATTCNALVPLPSSTLLAVSEVLPVPPFSTGSAVPLYVMASVPDVVTGLPVMVNIVGAVSPTEVTVPVPPDAGVAHVPSPRQNVVPLALVPLFKLATGRFPVTSVASAIVLVATFTKSEPFHAISAFWPFKIVTPVVGPTPRTTTENPPVVALMTTYALLCAGAVILRSAVRAPDHRSTAARDWLLAPVVVVSVTSASVDSVVVPAMASSHNCVTAVLTVLPHVPESSPCTGSARPISAVYAVVIARPYVTTGAHVGVCALPTFCHVGVCVSEIACHPALIFDGTRPYTSTDPTPPTEEQPVGVTGVSGISGLADYGRRADRGRELHHKRHQ